MHHLADLGHRHVALVNRSAELVASGYGPSHRALAGFRAAVAGAGPGRRRRLLRRRHRLRRGLPGAVAGDVPAAHRDGHHQRGRAARRAARLAGAGLSVPGDFSVTGVAARHWAEDFPPPLTAADVPMADMGAEAVALLLEIISAPGRRAAPPPLQPRPSRCGASTGPARHPLSYAHPGRRPVRPLGRRAATPPAARGRSCWRDGEDLR